ncbi:hypothetical protein EC968_009603 [Mortierella alpina]|nr:hypothetical protein EC968_009603 [Mortierella alpina]
MLYSAHQSPHQQHGSDSAQNSMPILHPHDTPSEMPGHPLDMMHNTSDRPSTTHQPYGDINRSLQESGHYPVKEEDTYADGQNRVQAVPVQAAPTQVRQQNDNINIDEHRQQPTAALRHIAASQRPSVPSSSNQDCRQSYTTPFQQPGATESERRGQLQQLKTEQMDDNEAFDSTLAMVLDDHLSLMDHLDMMPDIQVYREMSVQHPFQGTDPARNRILGAEYCSEAAPAVNSMAYFTDLAHGPSDMAAVKQEEFTNEDPMLYFDGISSSSQGPETMVTASLSDAMTSATNTLVLSSEVHEKGYSAPPPTSFGFMQGNGHHVKSEPSFPQIQRPPQQYVEPSYHPLEQQHPLDMGSIDMVQRTMISNGISSTEPGFGSKALPLQHQQYS